MTLYVSTTLPWFIISMINPFSPLYTFMVNQSCVVGTVLVVGSRHICVLAATKAFFL